ncbi:MAG: phosphoglycerate dehydrogenase [Ferruginibacter sp.]|nr:phosphoglycerate dehydrogenase [Ferruginibacter sp.]
MPAVSSKTSYPKEKIRILFLESISKTAVQQFKNAGYQSVESLHHAMDEAALIKAVKGVHILGIRSKTYITPKVLEAATSLQSIGCFCIGTNQVDLEEATRKGVAVFNAPYSNTRSVAEMVIGASVMLVRKIMDKNKAAHEGIWQKDAGGSHELRGKTIGIIGYGNIGSQVSVLAEALGMQVKFYDAETKLPLGNASDCKSLKNLLSVSDVITLHVPQLPSTVQMINKTTLSWVKKGAVLINYARGEVVDIPALKQALTSGRLSGAALDVFPEEPEKNGDPFQSPLQGMSNVLLTPHIGGSTVEAQENIGLDVSTKLLNYLEKGISTGSKTIPALALPPQEHTHRILHIHRNVPGVLGNVNSLLSKHKINVVGQYLKTNDQIGYVVLDIDKHLSENAVSLLKKSKDTIRVRSVY